ncbi:MAG TPA: phage tail tape measure protein [Solirubrobacteraceae bacterium]|nr:phage tail tape measure protein [Solirubrobacteraceae bacterium]
MLVGSAEILVVANTREFKRQLEDDTKPAFAGVRKEAESAGQDAGAGLRSGVKQGTHGLESDLASAGAAGGAGLRRGVTDETGKLAGDVTKDGARAGEGLHKGVSGGLSKLASAISQAGLPLGGLTAGLERAGSAAEHAGTKSSGFVGTLDKVGGTALAGVAAAGVVVAGVGVHMAESMQSADTAIAGAAGTSVAAGEQIGNAFLGTAGKSEFGAQEMAKAFASVAGQLKATEGHALSSGQALQVMTAADELATAKQIALGTSTSTLAKVMQAFRLPTTEAAHASDVLFQASNATGQSVEALGTQLAKVRSKLGDTGGSLGDLSGLLVDMTDQGITGRAAISGLNSGMNTLQKTATGVQTAMSAQNAAYAQMPPALQKLADAYRSGTMTSSEFTKATGALPPAQAALAKSFATASTAVQSAQVKYKELGITVFDARGKFVGMGSIIDQLHPKFAQMTEQQRLAAAATLFGSGAARQMAAVISAGPAAYDKATSSVNKMGAAHNAAAQQSHTLHVEEETLKAEMGDLATRVGTVLIPVITAMVGAFVKATAFVTSHKGALIALAAVVTGILGPAIAVFTINKMASFGQSFVTAGGHVKDFANGVQTAVNKVIGLFAKQSTAAETSAGKIQASTAAASGAVATEATEVGTSTAAVDTSFAGTGTAATAAASEIGVAETAAAGEVAAADTAIEGANVAAGASFTGLLGSLGKLLGAAGLAYGAIQGGKAIAHAIDPSGSKGGSPSGTIGPGGAPTTVTGGTASGLLGQIGNLLGIHISSPFGGETYAQQQYNLSHDTGPPGTVRSNAVSARAASASYSPTTWAETLLSQLGDRVTSANVQALVGWEKAEGGNWANSAKYNPLNTTQTAPGATSINSVGVKAYQSWDQGLAATVQTLKNGNYGQILSALAAGRSAGSVASAIGASPWGTGASLVAQTIASTRVGSVSARGGSGSASVPAYVDPLAHASGVSRGRTDQGVDYGFSGPLGALGAGVIEAVKQFQGFGTTIEERLTSGPDKGKLIYTALENGAKIATHAGARVAAGQQIATGFGTGGIEMGFAQGSGSQYGLPTTRYGPGQSHDVPTAGGIAFSNFLASIKAGTAGSTGGGAGAASAVTIAQERASLNATIAAEKAAVAKQIATLQASVKGKGVTVDEKTKVAAEIAALRSGLSVQIAQQRGALSIQTAQQKAELAKQTTDTKAGTSTLAKMLAAIHSGSLKSLQGVLDTAHTTALTKLEHSLDSDHSKALSALSAQLVKVHQQALQALEKAAAAAQQAAWEKMLTALLTRETTDLTRTATDQAAQIADATKVYLDQQAAVGLTGAALIAANAQTALDQVVQSGDAAIQAAQAGVDNAASGTALAQAQAANLLAQAQAAETVAQAQAQSALDIANANATAASSAGSSTSTSPTPATTAPQINLNIYGNGQMNETQLLAEVGWAIRTGALPVAPPVPAPAAA